ncbi:DUF4219 domain-containing protein/UBN2 domain-containing protein [Cephalotus follicularis]|uniref:DUF4219 domain-containing protein/UBN2 domain-containing protein n=1 Tax=Cephalotus follicularis TaxID=3775 RepID=A0A1Q3B6Q1_CEPFO|nr:DUF4219 domain-containing protein/UBN2 domain-containing protein [Cephalotus follicularis]
MATFFNDNISQSFNKPPSFDGNNYSYWKTRMTIFIQSLDYQLWNIISNGPEIPTKLVDGQRVLKLNNKYNDHDYKLLQLNAKAKNVIFCALNPSEFNRVSSLDFTKEMWDRLMVTYEGTNQVNDTKINRLVHDYEPLTMLENENISSMYARFNEIITLLETGDLATAFITDRFTDRHSGRYKSSTKIMVAYPSPTALPSCRPSKAVRN